MLFSLEKNNSLFEKELIEKYQSLSRQTEILTIKNAISKKMNFHKLLDCIQNRIDSYEVISKDPYSTEYDSDIKIQELKRIKEDIISYLAEFSNPNQDLKEFYHAILIKMDESNNSIIDEILKKEDNSYSISEESLNYYCDLLSDSSFIEEVKKEIENESIRREAIIVSHFCEKMYAFKDLFYENLNSIIDYNVLVSSILDVEKSLEKFDASVAQEKVQYLQSEISSLSKNRIMAFLYSKKISSLVKEKSKFDDILKIHGEKEEKLKTLKESLESVHEKLKQSSLDSLMRKVQMLSFEEGDSSKISYLTGLSQIYEEGDLKSYLDELMRMKAMKDYELEKLSSPSSNPKVKKLMEKRNGIDFCRLMEGELPISIYLFLLQDLLREKDFDSSLYSELFVEMKEKYEFFQKEMDFVPSMKRKKKTL